MYYARTLFFLSFCICSVFSASAQKQLTNFGNMMTHAGASVTLYGDFINNGVLTDSATLITLNGSAAQNIGGTSASTFKNLQLSNSSGAYLTSSISISKELNITAGTFTSTGFDVKLISNQNNTARIAPITGDFAGNITMQRYLPSGSTGWRFLAAPVTGATINDWQDDFITTGFPGATYPAFSFTSVYTYDESTTGSLSLGYQAPTSSSLSILPGKGYWCYIGPVPLTVDVTGPPAKFLQTFSVSYTGGSGATNDGWVMLGNPYPSAIDWNSASWTKTNINNAIYIWNANLQQYSSYVGTTGTHNASNIIPSSQAFWIQTNAINPVLTCNENVKSSNSQPFIKPLTTTNLRLLIKGNSFSDECVLQFDAAYKNKYEPEFDARKLFSSNPAVPSISSLDSTGQDLSINSLQTVNRSIKIPIRALVGASGVYTIGIDSSSILPSDQCIILEDLKSGIKINLAIASSYTFYLSDTTRSARFLLHLNSSPETKYSSASCADNKDGLAIATVDMSGIFKYTWKDSNNVILRNIQTALTADTLKSLAAGQYSLQIAHIGGVCLSYNKTFIISAPPGIKSVFQLAKDTVLSGLSDSLIINNTSANASKFEWNFGDGMTDSVADPKPHHYLSPGTYVITLQAKEKTCSATSTKTVVVNKFIDTGMPESTKSAAFSVYPNPAYGLFHFSVPAIQNTGTISIYDCFNRVVVQQHVNSSSFAIDLRNFAKGVYLYTITYSSGEILNGMLVNQ